MCGMLDELHRLALLVAPGDLRHTLLGDDGGVLEGRHRCLDERHDGRHVGLGVPGTQRHEGLSARRVQGTDGEVALPAEARIDLGVDARRVGLVVEVDLQRRVDACHQRLGGDDRRRVGGLGAQDTQSLVAVRPGVERGRPHEGRRGDGAGRVQRPGLVQLQDPIADDFTPDPQAPLAAQPVQRCVGDLADAQLQGGTVSDAPGHQVADDPSTVRARHPAAAGRAVGL